MQPAAGRRTERARYLALQQQALARGFDSAIGDRDGGQQGPRIGVQWQGIQASLGRDFYDLAEIHDGHPVAEMADHGEIVRYEE